MGSDLGVRVMPERPEKTEHKHPAERRAERKTKASAQVKAAFSERIISLVLLVFTLLISGAIWLLNT